MPSLVLAARIGSQKLGLSTERDRLIYFSVFGIDVGLKRHQRFSPSRHDQDAPARGVKDNPVRIGQRGERAKHRIRLQINDDDRAIPAPIAYKTAARRGCERHAMRAFLARNVG
ncbi:MAG: hypothetical protein M3Y27_09905, partial [Acidobacteriota bacterium]|nr:hypothetical protein [Acidobacteriota bacterium]